MPVNGLRVPEAELSGFIATVAAMEMLGGDQITQADLTDWRKLGQGLHAHFLVRDFAAGARFVSAIAEAGDAVGHHPRVTLGGSHVDIKLISDDAVFRDDKGVEHTVEWVTQRDVDLARRVSEIAAEQECAPNQDRSPRSSWLSTPPTAPGSRRCGRPC